MRKPSVTCALLAAMIAKHRWGTPIDEENLLSIAALEPNDYPTASDVFDHLRREPSIVSEGNRGIELNNSEFDTLADVLYHECGWEPFQIRSRLKHDEGVEQPRLGLNIKNVSIALNCPVELGFVDFEEVGRANKPTV